MSTTQESSPNQNETSELKSDDTLKPAAEITSNNSPPPKTTTTDEATALSDDHDLESDPKAKSISQAVIQSSSKNSLPADALSQTTSINSTTKEDVKALNKDAAAADPQLQVLEKPPSEDKITSEHTTPTKKQEVDSTKAIQEDSAAVAETTPADSQVQPVKNDSTLKDSPSAGKSVATHGAETDEGKSLAEELTQKVEPHPPVQEISPAADEATPEELSPRKSDFSPPDKINDPEPQPAKTVKEDSTDVAKPSSKKSKLKKLIDFFRPSKGKVSKSKSSTSSQNKVEDAESKGQNKVEDAESKGQNKVEDTESKAKQLISLIRADFAYITDRMEEQGLYNKELGITLKELGEKLDSASQDFEGLQTKQGKLKDLQELRKDVVKLKLQDPSKYKFDGDEKDQLKNLQFRSRAKQGISPEVLIKMPRLHKSGVFETSIEFKDFEARYRDLDDNRLKLCLLCFSAFPGDIIRKRLMVQWWVSEGFASEEEADKYFTQLIENGLIEPVNKNRSPSVGRCQMHPFYRSALVMLSERAKFLNFGAKGEPKENFSGSFQSCLVGEGLISFEDLQEHRLEIEDLEKVHLLINVGEHILEFKPNWLSKMSNLNFLYLGRWKDSATDHIEVEDTDFFSGLEVMRCLKFLSLQGISNIIALPKSILQMENLEILDVRACYNLETIPERIDFLKNLIHLDMSECYLLDHMPKGLSLLVELKVIKGFVVGDHDEKNAPCTLDDLGKLPKLSKLCIYSDLKEFPEEQHVKALEKLKELCKLTITWGGSALRDKKVTAESNTKLPQDQPDSGKKKVTAESNTKLPQDQPDSGKKKVTAGSNTKLPQDQPDSGKKKVTAESNTKLPPKLMKLDLKCFPKSTTPNWLELRNLKDHDLKKLYIRGGRLSDLGQYEDADNGNIVLPVKKETWKVEVLRLKYLSEIKMEWRQLHELFPHLVYLEQVSCPKLTLFPCDANGVWINKIISKASIQSP